MQHHEANLKYTVPADRIANPDTASAEELRTAIGDSLPKRSFISPRIVTSVIRVIEFVAVPLIALATAWYYPGFKGAPNGYYYLAAALAMAVVYTTMLQMLGLYRLTALLRPLRHVSRVTLVWLLAFIVLVAGMVLTKNTELFSRVWLALWFAAGLMFALATRLFSSALVRHWNANGQFNRRAVLVGGGETAERVIATLDSSTDTDVTLLGIFDDRDDQRAPTATGGLRKLGTVTDLVDFVRSTRVDLIIVTIPLTAENRLLTILNRLWVLPVDIRLSAHDQKLRYRPRAYSHIGNLPLLDVFDKPLGEWGPLVKAAEDKIIASFAILLTLPVMAAVALAVKLGSKGPVIFRQKRYGFNNELIEVFKFRSMFTSQLDTDASRLVTKGDPRVTPVGRFIRKTSLDELPQLFNVLKGDLSLVGPRPHATKAKAADALYEQVVDGDFARHKVKPGITGWAQINGWRGETDTEEKIERRVEHDLYYIDNWSLTFDLYILARTPFSLLSTENAY